MTSENGSRIPKEVKVILGYDVLISALHTVEILNERNYLFSKIAFGIYLTIRAYQKGLFK